MNEITLDSPAELQLTLSDDERRATLRRLRAELADRTVNWRQLAACRGMDVKIFYAPEEIRDVMARLPDDGSVEELLREALRTLATAEVTR